MLDFSYVKSPVSGSISSNKVTNVGQIVRTGDLLSEIVPKDDISKNRSLYYSKRYSLC